jgi:3-deoxy-D-manno-octulosonate 8-phosphate phosphatase (KDO 8-P phosphatase)
VSIKAVVTDVDGVITDGTVLLDETGREQKRVSFADIMGLSLGRRAGLSFAFVSGEAGPVLQQIAAKFGVSEVYGGCKDKAAAVREFASKHGFETHELCFVGDDVNDVPAFELVGLAAAPADAHPVALAKAGLVTTRSGGRGALREIIDRLLAEGQTAPAPTASSPGR